MSPNSKSRNNELGSVLTKLKSDRYASFLGIQITKIERGYAQANLKVAERMLNFNGFAHGGLVFSLADAAFAAACNSFDQTAVALSFHIAYRRPVQVNTRLVAEAVEESSGKSTALYKIVVKTDDERIVAICEGLAYKLPSRAVENDGPEAI
ncbi:MAG TPA: hotdog fold thioesterase [Candidatus Bathyarchaeia archaeon]|nr:hotdog fold thioesterase [Candidatus Bathyarchaeia archaeon]